jgi:hypothetical protein
MRNRTRHAVLALDTILVFSLLWFCADSSLASDSSQQLAAKVASIKKQMTYVEMKLLYRCQRVRTSLTGFSTEGGTLNAFFLKAIPRKMVAEHMGEMGRATEYYYFWKGRLIALERVETRYDKPFGKAHSVTMESLFFSDGKLISHRDVTGNDYSLETSESQQLERTTLDVTRRLLVMAKRELQKISSTQASS